MNLLRLVSLTQFNAFEAHSNCVYQQFILFIAELWLYHSVFIHSLIGDNEGCFQFGAIRCRPVMNTHI